MQNSGRCQGYLSTRKTSPSAPGFDVSPPVVSRKFAAGELGRIARNVVRNRYIYLLLLPGVVFFIIFSYVPMYGVTLAFKEFKIGKGVLGSPWVGFANFVTVFRLEDFWRSVSNTVIISLQRLLIEFPVPIILALMLNEVSRSGLKKFYQTVLTFPNFLSWIVVYGLVYGIFSDAGIANKVLISLGLAKQSLLTNPTWFRPLLYVSSIWKSAGWLSIIYLAAISSIDPELYSAALVDGANRFQQTLHVTWPGMRSTVAILLILQVGNMMNAGFDQIFNMYNVSVYSVSDIIDTYIFRRSLVTAQDFGGSTAIGLFKSLINFCLLVGANAIVKRFGEEGVA